MLESMNLAILIGSVLVVAAVFTSLFSFRFGAPLLLVFLVVGLLAGEDGIGRIDFDNGPAAFFIGSIALAVILFDSGFETRVSTLRIAALPAATLATGGVVLTAVLVGLAAQALFGFGWTVGLLVGAIVAPTDAAAVFFLLRVGGITLRDRVRSTLEIESGTNDPIAIFLTLTLLEFMVASTSPEGIAVELIGRLLLQVGVGSIVGLAGGYAIVQIVNRANLEAALYPIVVIALALTTYALAGMIWGSGFLAVYVAGLVAGNSRMRRAVSLRRFQQGTTWLSQIAMFLTLGLLAIPPVIAGLPDAQAIFNIAFIVVLASLLVQGWTISPMARFLGLVVPPRHGPVDRIELELPGRGDYEIVGYVVHPDSAVAKGQRIPRWARPSLVVRDGHSLRPHRFGRPQAGDQVYVITTPEYVGILDRLFGGQTEGADDPRLYGEFLIDPATKIADLANAYGVKLLDGDETLTVAELLRRDLAGDIELGDRVGYGPVDLIVRRVNDDHAIEEVGLALESRGQSRPRVPVFQSRKEIAEMLRKRLGRAKSKADETPPDSGGKRES